jgi:hypothetical protein
LRDVQISNSMKLLQVHNGYHNVYLSRTINAKLFTKGGNHESIQSS